ncbi:MAG: RIP metalloprotease RseP [Deltaproteobacteria bacterium]|nr:RIP metalloprotease RseP [Deltaproteobacteria bacterium]
MFGYNLFVGIIVLGVLVFIHELGHFLVAKVLGIGVLRFSIGFGKKVVGWRRGETEYQIALIPLGGYVKLLGESPDENVPETEVHRSFTAQSIIRRACVVVAGPVMNFLLAGLFLPLVFMIGVPQPGYFTSPPRIGWVEPDSPAEEAGFAPGDLVLSINGVPVKDWESLINAVIISPNEELEVAFERNGRAMSATLVPRADRNTGAGMAGFQPDVPKMVIKEVVKGRPADRAGMRPGDIVISINGISRQDYAAMRRLIEESPGEELSFEIRRGKETLVLAVKPVADPETKLGKVGVSFLPGFPDMEVIERRYGFLAALDKGSRELVRLTGLTFSVLGKFLSGKLSIRHLGGPITIVRYAGQAAHSGLASLLQFVAFLSLNLAILNVLPIPVLDGGHLGFLLIESVIGRPVSPKSQEMAYKIGFTILIILMIVVFYNDLVKMFLGFP